jgi:hypothetical protein
MRTETTELMMTMTSKFKTKRRAVGSRLIVLKFNCNNTRNLR